MISCYDLTVQRTGADEPILKDVELQIDSGTWARVVGEPAAGKTLLYSILSLQALPEQGELIIGGRHVRRLDDRRLAKLRRMIGACSANPRLIEDLSFRDNIALPLKIRQSYRENKLSDLLERMGLSCGWRTARNLSSAERRVAGLLRAAVATPKLILIDGGLRGLSETFQTSYRTYLRQLKNENETTIVIFSTPTEPADRECDIELRLSNTGLRRQDSQRENGFI